MEWVYLLVAGAFEIVFSISLKLSAGFTRLGASLVTLVAVGLSLFFLSKALKSLPLGTAYAVWTGIGAVGTAVLGIILFQDSTEPLRLFFIMVIVAGLIGLRLAS